MATTTTNMAVGCVAGMPVLLTEYTVDRPLLVNERRGGENAFIRFANARCLPDLLAAVDEMLSESGPADIIGDLMSLDSAPEPLDPSRAEEVCAFFGAGRPTRTTVERTREAIEAWSLARARPVYQATENGRPCGMLNLFTPLEDLVKASEDLRRTSLLMAYLVGKTDFGTAHGMPEGDRSARMRTMAAEEPRFLHGYYESLGSNTGNAFAHIHTFNAVSQLHLYREESVESTIRSYVEAAFTLLMSDERKVMGSDLRTHWTHNTVLSAAWSYFADGLNREGGAGSIGVCRRCGRFFEQQRSTRVYCGDSCRVLALREGGGDQPERRETEVMRIRRETGR